LPNTLGKIYMVDVLQQSRNWVRLRRRAEVSSDRVDLVPHLAPNSVPMDDHDDTEGHPVAALLAQALHRRG
jgi:hypothetical protein